LLFFKQEKSLLPSLIYMGDEKSNREIPGLFLFQEK